MKTSTVLQFCLSSFFFLSREQKSCNIRITTEIVILIERYVKAEKKEC